MDQTELKPDEMFEKFLAERTSGLPERRKKTVSRLARSSFYGHCIFHALYPKNADEPPDIVYGDEKEKFTLARPRYHLEDTELSDQLWQEFVDGHWDRYKHYADLEIQLAQRSPR